MTQLDWSSSIIALSWCASVSVASFVVLQASPVGATDLFGVSETARLVIDLSKESSDFTFSVCVCLSKLWILFCGSNEIVVGVHRLSVGEDGIEHRRTETSTASTGCRTSRTGVCCAS
eukprot:TRINITY_DN8988_c0_g1_i1.p2 TRINITY_DN8988_c0_g1~~TRINITY_DN8988_c0_g1_i1.p2  ORF type:complete len:118 (+),score=8.17 TRINITY_DN8988_c0_g1_i1:343-696(+)